MLFRSVMRTLEEWIQEIGTITTTTTTTGVIMAATTIRTLLSTITPWKGTKMRKSSKRAKMSSCHDEFGLTIIN